jgi:mRNA interferase RelE/StbE
MPYTILLTRPAHKQLQKCPPAIRPRLITAIDALQHTPRPPGAGALHGLTDTYRIRVGDYRIVYAIHEEQLLILVIRVGHRREVYRGL